jgi:hypothetical protein
MADLCEDGIFQAITSTCQTAGVAGIEEKGWLINRTEIASLTQTDNVISDITMLQGKQSYTCTVTRKSLNGMHELKKEDGYPDRYLHKMSVKIFENDAASQLNADNMKDLVLIVERKQKTADGDGIFIAYGVETGMYKDSDTTSLIENNGARLIELGTDAASGEKFSSYIVYDTDYATTKAMIVATETPAA